MSDDARQRYRDYVAVSLEGYRILFEADERGLIGDGIAKFELDGDQARGIVAVVANQECQILERDVSRNMLNVMTGLAGKKGAVSKAKFAQGVAILLGMTKGQVNEARARAWLKQVIEDSALTVRGSGLLRRTRWFRKIKPVA
jgi:hypothetical protein